MDIASLRQALLAKAATSIAPTDPSHDLAHAHRVLANVEAIAAEEGGDLEILIPAALFHDAVNYPKNDPRAKQSTAESAELVAGILANLPGYPIEKIDAVKQAVTECSFSKGIVPSTHEGRVLFDADMLEATGAITLMRIFCTSGQLGRAFYHEGDPFHEAERPAEPFAYALDAFRPRLFAVEGRLNTATAQRMAVPRLAFLRAFLDQLRSELPR
jgi:uncharacterized protein